MIPADLSQITPNVNGINRTARDIINEPFYKSARKEILVNNKLPAGCFKCANTELAGGVSTRMNKLNAMSINRKEMVDALAHTSLETGELDPDYFKFAFIECSFGTDKCNFKCRICGPKLSSAIAAENKILKIKDVSLSHEEKDKRDKWYFDSLMHHKDELKQIFITGGEPFLSKYVWDFLKSTDDFSRLETLSITTNCSTVKTKYGDVFDILTNFKSKSVKSIGISLDAIGELGEYCRHGTVWPEIDSNFSKFLIHSDSCSQYKVNVSASVSIYSLPGLIDLFNYLQNKAKEHLPNAKLHILVNHVTGPSFLDVEILPQHVKAQYLKIVSDLIDNLETSHPNLGARGLHPLLLKLQQRDVNQLLDRRLKFINETSIRDDVRGESVAKLPHNEYFQTMFDARFLSDADY